MEDFDLEAFANSLKYNIYYRMPYDPNSSDAHIRDIAFKNNPIMKISDDKLVFELGNDMSESQAPYYHILEDAQVISKPNRGTQRTRGSQDSIANTSQRNYGQITRHTTRNGNVSYFQEYRKNVRGSRSLIAKSQYIAGTYTDSKGKQKLLRFNTNSKYYYNRHYHYIETILDDNDTMNNLCSIYGLKMKRKQETSLQQDFYDMFRALESEEDY